MLVALCHGSDRRNVCAFTDQMTHLNIDLLFLTDHFEDNEAISLLVESEFFLEDWDDWIED